MRYLYIYIIMWLMATSVMAENNPTIHRNVIISKVGNSCLVSMTIEPNLVQLKPNHQMFITPYLESVDGLFSARFPSVVLSGRNMHYIYLRTGKTVASEKTNYDITAELLCNGKSAAYSYNESIPMEFWMQYDDVKLCINVDTCGCGRDLGSNIDSIPANLSPLNRMMIVPFPTPVAEVPKIINHHGKARVEFEVDKFELHDEVYSYVHKVTHRKHVIDNRAELQIIDDTVKYALTSPNVEIESISVTGYASPESPYQHNDYLATNRSRVLADFLADRYHLTHDHCTYHAVPENWTGFREMAVSDTTITDEERANLLALIDRPTYGPSDFDAKEQELKTSSKFSKLYSEKIHPDWFPKLRYTDFDIRTRLKPMSLEQLRDVIIWNPELLSLNQIYTVAANCEHGSEEFHRAMGAALIYYPDDETANCNAAALAIEDKDYERAATYLPKAGQSDEANILRGIVEVSRFNYEKALEYFNMAHNSPVAKRNIQILMAE